MINILIIDVGGTNVRFQFFEYDLSTKKNKLIKMEKTLTKNFDCFETAIKSFLDKIEKKEKNKLFGSIAIAGPVENNTFIKAANLKWKGTNTKFLKNKFNFEKCFLLNDFQAVGNATKCFENYKLVELNSNSIKEEEGNLLIIGIGTGVGVCFVTKYTNNIGIKQEVVNPSEFSHVSMGVKNYFDFIYNRFVRFLLKIDDFDNLRMEIMFSGKGLVNIYNFLNFIQNFELGKHKFNNLLKCNFDIEYNENEKIDFANYSEVKINTKEIFEKFKKGEKIAELTMAYFMELLGNAVYIFSAAYLPTRGTIFVGDFIRSFGHILEKKKDKLVYFDIFLQNVKLEGHLKDKFQKLSYSFFMGDADNLGLVGSLNYLMKKIHN